MDQPVAKRLQNRLIHRAGGKRAHLVRALKFPVLGNIVGEKDDLVEQCHVLPPGSMVAHRIGSFHVQSEDVADINAARVGMKKRGAVLDLNVVNYIRATKHLQ